MAFTSSLFLLLVFPIVLLVYLRLQRKKIANYYITLISVLFYQWSGIKYSILLLALVVIAFATGLIIQSTHNRRIKKVLLAASIFLVLMNLFYYKYYGTFMSWLTKTFACFDAEIIWPNAPIILPLGVSFYTFSIISYILDVYWENCEAQKNVFHLISYVFLFPKVTSGPLMRYNEFQSQLAKRSENISLNNGIERFLKGVVKKVLIADQLSTVVSYCFSLPDGGNTMSAWIGIFLYLLQLYYDFSGYSDIAIGIGLMLGIKIPENFDHPYMAKSVAEYWRRWHITLGNWFKNYLYTPLVRTLMTIKIPCTDKKLDLSFCDIISLIIVWLITGIWHGAGLTYVFYGLWYGMIIVIERIIGIKKKARKKKQINSNKKSSAVLKHMVTMFSIMIGQSLFRSPSINYALSFIKQLFSFNFKDWPLVLLQLTPSVIAATCFGLIFCFPVYGKMRTFEKQAQSVKGMVVGRTLDAALVVLYILSICYIAGGSYSPFLYEVF